MLAVAQFATRSGISFLSSSFVPLSNHDQLASIRIVLNKSQAQKPRAVRHGRRSGVDKHVRFMQRYTSSIWVPQHGTLIAASTSHLFTKVRYCTES